MQSIATKFGEPSATTIDPDAVRHQLESEYCGHDRHRWKKLAALTLYSQGWSVSHVALAFGLHRGQMSRILNQARDEMKEFFETKGIPISQERMPGQESTPESGFSNPHDPN